MILEKQTRLKARVVRNRLLGKGASIIPEEFEEGIRIRVHVKLHLPLLHNLERKLRNKDMVDRGTSGYLELCV